MRYRALCVAAATSFILLGCAAMAPEAAGPCNMGVCKVSVRITACQGGISAYPDPVHIPRGVNEIHWEITSTGYEFTANGITFKQPPGGVFTDPRLLSPTKYKWHDNNNNTGTTTTSYYYNIEVRAASGSTCRYDPTIIND